MIQDIQLKAELGRYRYPRHVDDAPGAELRRPDVPACTPLARAARGLPRALRHGDGARHAVRRATRAAADPDHRLRHEFGALSRNAKAGDRPRRRAVPAARRPPATAACTRWSGRLGAARLPDLPEPLRVRRARHGERRRRRDRRRSGREAGHRRRAAGREGVRRGGADARPAARRRPALAGAASRLHRSRRPAAQDRADPRGDRLAGAGVRQDRRGARRATTSSWQPRPAPT